MPEQGSTLQIALIVAGAGLLGSLAGGLTSFAVAWLSQKRENDRALARLAVEGAIAEHAAAAKREGSPPVPLYAYAFRQLEMLRWMASGPINAASYSAVSQKVGRVLSVIAAQRELADSLRSARDPEGTA
jgi:hypothetical protein